VTRQEKAIADLQGRLQPLLLRPQACPDCITLLKRALAGEARNASGREAFATVPPPAPSHSAGMVACLEFKEKANRVGLQKQLLSHLKELKRLKCRIQTE
jgi:hypothetical protein